MKSLILAIETSCDETSVALIKDGLEILSNRIYSQIEIHKKFGGVVPEVASRNHVEKIDLIVEEALEESQVSLQDLTAVAVTYGPGLVGPLLVGVSYGKALAYSLGVPLIPVNHIEGHIMANYLAFPSLQAPFLALIVSGGHTHIIHVPRFGVYEILGKTRDDAVGEAFDKVARTLGFGYPGGPQIDEAAKEGDPAAIDFPRTMLEKGSLSFSFSGIKSAVLNHVNQQRQKGLALAVNDIAASFQEAVVDVLVDKMKLAIEETGQKTLVIAGGVAANSRLRERFRSLEDELDLTLMYPPLRLCTDNAAMIGAAAYLHEGTYKGVDFHLNAVPNLKLDNPQ